MHSTTVRCGRSRLSAHSAGAFPGWIPRILNPPEILRNPPGIHPGNRIYLCVALRMARGIHLRSGAIHRTEILGLTLDQHRDGPSLWASLRHAFAACFNPFGHLSGMLLPPALIDWGIDGHRVLARVARLLHGGHCRWQCDARCVLTTDPQPPVNRAALAPAVIRLSPTLFARGLPREGRADHWVRSEGVATN